MPDLSHLYETGNWPELAQLEADEFWGSRLRRQRRTKILIRIGGGLLALALLAGLGGAVWFALGGSPLP